MSVGRCIPGIEMEIRDDDGTVLPDRHVGAVWLRTNALFQGYHGKPELTQQAVIDGWLRTGDIGYQVDDHLFFAVVDVKRIDH